MSENHTNLKAVFEKLGRAPETSLLVFREGRALAELCLEVVPRDGRARGGGFGSIKKFNNGNVPI